MKTRVLWSACVVTFGCLASGLSLAQSGPDCSGVANDMARLKCYDEQAARQKKKTVTPPPAAAIPAPAAATPAPAARTATPPPPKPSANPSDFGLDAESIRKKQAAVNPETAKDPEQIVAQVKGVTTRALGQYRITLEDGQVWEETQHSSSSQAPDVGETVTIKRGMLGSYFLSKKSGLALRVKRID